jgi:hypothetical protein
MLSKDIHKDSVGNKVDPKRDKVSEVYINVYISAVQRFYILGRI